MASAELTPIQINEPPAINIAGLVFSYRNVSYFAVLTVLFSINPGVSNERLGTAKFVDIAFLLP